jgi:hypothetical protein
VSEAFINPVIILLSTKVIISQEVNVLTAAKDSFFERLLHCKTYAELSKDKPMLLVLDIQAINIISYCGDNGIMYQFLLARHDHFSLSSFEMRFKGEC